MGGKEGREEEEEDSGVGVGNVERGPFLPLFSSFSWHCGRGRSVVLTRTLLHCTVCGGGRRTEDEVGGRRKGLLLFPGPEGERGMLRRRPPPLLSILTPKDGAKGGRIGWAVWRWREADEYVRPK